MIPSLPFGQICRIDKFRSELCFQGHCPYVRSSNRKRTYRQIYESYSTIFQSKQPFIENSLYQGSFTLEDRTFCLSVRFRFSDRTHILWPWRLSTWPQNDLSNLFQCNCLCRLLLWPNCFSLDILLFRHILFLEQEQTEIFFFVGYPAYQIELILEHAGPTKGVYSERCNQGHEKPKKPKSFQKWQKYGFIKLKLKVHPLLSTLQYDLHIWRSYLVRSQVDDLMKISGIVTVTHPGFISDVKNIYLLTSL